MISSLQSRVRALGFGLAGAVLGACLRQLVYPVLGVTAPGVTFVPFIMGAAWYGGLAAGVVATVGAYVLARYVFGFTQPQSLFADILRTLLYFSAGLAISWLTDSLRQAKKRAEADRHRAATILASVTDGLIGLDPEFRLAYLNAAAERLLKRVSGDVLGEPLESKLQPAMQQRSQISFEYRDPKSNRWLDVHGYPDEIGGLSVLLRDISERKLAEQTMAEANRALERSNAELQQFAYVAAHDLREPLRNVMNYSEMIGRKYGEVLGDEGGELVKVAVTGARRMQALVDDLLLYCQVVGEEKRRQDPVDCDAVLSFLVGNFSRELAECDGRISWGHIPRLCASESQVLQLFQNLVGNAVKYRANQRPLLVEISAQERERDWLISVKDNGIGIAAQYQQEEIFRLFRRLHGRDIPGTGLGLAICKRIVEHYSGTIWVEGQEGKGSTFFFTFPSEHVEPCAHAASALTQSATVQQPSAHPPLTPGPRVGSSEAAR